MSYYQKKMVQVAKYSLTAENLAFCLPGKRLQEQNEPHSLLSDTRSSLAVLAGVLQDRRENAAGLTAAEFALLYDFLDTVRGVEPRQAETPEVPPVEWQLATWQETREHQGEVHYFTRQESGRMLKQALAKQWPGIKVSLKTNSYGTTTVQYQYLRGANYWHVLEFAERFAGAVRNAPADGDIAAHRWRPTPGGRQLIRHGLVSVSVDPRDGSGRQVTGPRPDAPLFT